MTAVGYRSLEDLQTDIPETHVMAPGHYRLVVEGKSSASFRGNAAAAESPWTVVREFDVVPPPLRPYLRYATLGDERIFGLQAGGWNPNPPGQGFGHYPDHLGQLRSSVAYLDKIYPSLFVRTDDQTADVPVQVVDCGQGTPAGTKASREWRVETGQAQGIEDELSFRVREAAGYHQISVKRIGLDGASVGEVVDQWTYRVSRFASPTAHLTTKAGLTHAIGPFGCRSLHASVPSTIPMGFDVDAVAAAQIGVGWTLPKFIGALPGIENPDAGLSFLQLLEWCRIHTASPYPSVEGPFARPEVPDLCLLMDRATAPVGLLLRTPEPCDWRRVEVVAVTAFAGATARRFSVKLLPSPDGCQCCLVLLAEGVPVRVPKGDLLLRIRFKLEADPLPRLTLAADTGQKFEDVLTVLAQPAGATWWEQ